MQLGRLLVNAGLISEDQLSKALEEQKKTAEKIGSILIKLDYIDEDTLLKFLSKQFRVPSISIEPQDVDPDVIKLIPPDMANRYEVFPIRRKGRTLILGMVNPGDITAIDAVKFATGFEVEPVVIAHSKMKTLLEKFYKVTKEIRSVSDVEEPEEEEFFDFEDDAEIELEEEEEEEDISSASAQPVIKLVNYLISNAVRRKASDIHIEPFEKVLRVRYRIDGVLQQVAEPPYSLKNAIVSRIKIMTGTMDVAERRVPQDGRIRIKVDGKPIDLRVSIIPTIYGEKVVMRILDKSSLMLDMTQLGFEPDNLQKFIAAIEKPFGLVLVTGPTGSGKSTTLYSALARLNKPEIQILTVEDPVEYNIKGINQVQVNEEIGFDFSMALRAFLRQSPNVILVGEIRDNETASIAIRAALTGHLVLSTIHTNDAPSTVNRLVDMGIEPFLVASSLNLIQAQRLMRKVCPKCKEPYEPEEKLLREAGIDPEMLKGGTLYKRGKGCQLCGFTGYKGRIAVTEVMPITPQLRDMILRGATSDELRETARKEGMRTLREDAIIKLKKGITTVEEVLRVTAAI
ncbi:MAG TPA: type IV-A pilus assembly ATPase PilB [candidate division WOR-3 bacterium]|uniref:Type IV-A pilus assembly ATPase PilB n=1 Tax=candidate division WOR-3 bacterium TaxID=2052148 RepID=A0A7C0VAR9_UNCW3|nr:type IV-A pilus assembly ATPase PilB [candidate division WOR-3 bacterium]